MKIDPIVKDILQELKFNPNECLWEKHGATCMKHRYIEIAGQEKGVIIESLDEIEKKSAKVSHVLSIKIWQDQIWEMTIKNTLQGKLRSRLQAKTTP